MLLVFASSACAESCDDALGRFAYAQAEALAQGQLAQHPDVAAAWICLARSHYERGDFRAALATMQRTDGLSLSTIQQVLADNWYGVTLRRLGQRDLAWQHLQQALAVARQNGDQGGWATALHNTAGMLDDYGWPEQALGYFSASQVINPDAAERSASLNNMGLILADLGRVAEAEQQIRAAIALNRQGGHFHHLGKHLMNLGNLLRRQGRYAESRQLIAEGMTLVEQAGDHFWRGVGHRLGSWLAQAQGQWTEARRLLGMAAEDYAAAGAVVDERQARTELANLRR